MPKKYEPFKFKQFEVAQDLCAMKVGTDGVLLGALAPSDGNRILDIGTGTGVIALMMAQRNTSAYIDAIDVDINAFQQAKQNFDNSLWSPRLNAIHTDLKEYSIDGKYDLIVSNPPFFINSTPPPDSTRFKARHIQGLTFELILSKVDLLIAENGKFSLILPYNESQKFLKITEEFKFYPEMIYEFYPRKQKGIERLVITLSRINKPCTKSKLYHYNEQNDWSKEYKALTKEFYIVL